MKQHGNRNAGARKENDQPDHPGRRSGARMLILKPGGKSLIPAQGIPELRQTGDIRVHGARARPSKFAVLGPVQSARFDPSGLSQTNERRAQTIRAERLHRIKAPSWLGRTARLYPILLRICRRPLRLDAAADSRRSATGCLGAVRFAASASRNACFIGGLRPLLAPMIRRQPANRRICQPPVDTHAAYSNVSTFSTY